MAVSYIRSTPGSVVDTTLTLNIQSSGTDRVLVFDAGKIIVQSEGDKLPDTHDFCFLLGLGAPEFAASSYNSINSWGFRNIVSFPLIKADP